MQTSLEKVPHVTERKLRKKTTTNFSEAIIWPPQTGIHSISLLYLSHTKWMGRSKFPKLLCEMLFQIHGFWSSGPVFFPQYSADFKLITIIITFFVKYQTHLSARVKWGEYISLFSAVLIQLGALWYILINTLYEHS